MNTRQGPAMQSAELNGVVAPTAVPLVRELDDMLHRAAGCGAGVFPRVKTTVAIAISVREASMPASMDQGRGLNSLKPAP